MCPTRKTTAPLTKCLSVFWAFGQGTIYTCNATSQIGFVQQLAVAYITSGHWFFVVGWVPEHKDPQIVDEKLLTRYGIGVPRWERARRKKAGLASLHYLRFERLFVLIATHGKHIFFEEESKSIKDARKTPIRVFGYAISYRQGHCHVRIDKVEYQRIKAFLEGIATHRSAGSLESYIWNLPFEPYAPIRRQILNLVRAVNKLRATAGFEKLSLTCVRTKRRIVKPFG